MTRRNWIRTSLATLAASPPPPAAGPALSRSRRAPVQTVTGPVSASELGVTLMHEHIVTDLRAPAERKPGDYDPDDAFRTALPYLARLRREGCRTLVEITPLHIGRDVGTLARLSKASGLNIIAATGIYGAANRKFVPPEAREKSAEELAEIYVREIRRGVGVSGIRPGVIKTGVNPRTPLPEIERKLVRAAALAARETGLTAASHTGAGAAAVEELEIFAEAGVSAEKFIWVHAQNERDKEIHLCAARRGAWVEFDGVSETSIDRHVECVRSMRDAGLLGRTLISQDAGWYRPGAESQENYRGYTYLFTDFVPRLLREGFEQAEIDELLITNPARALSGNSG